MFKRTRYYFVSYYCIRDNKSYISNAYVEVKFNKYFPIIEVEKTLKEKYNYDKITIVNYIRCSKEEFNEYIKDKE